MNDLLDSTAIFPYSGYSYTDYCLIILIWSWLIFHEPSVVQTGWHQNVSFVRLPSKWNDMRPNRTSRHPRPILNYINNVWGLDAFVIPNKCPDYEAETWGYSNNREWMENWFADTIGGGTFVKDIFRQRQVPGDIVVINLLWNCRGGEIMAGGRRDQYILLHVHTYNADWDWNRSYSYIKTTA